MKKRNNMLQRVFLCVLISALVLTGMSFQGIPVLYAAEADALEAEVTDETDEPEAEVTDETVEPEAEVTDEKVELERIHEERAEGADAVDKTALSTVIGEAEKLKEADYLAQSWTKFATALQNAKDVNEKADATKEEVDTAVSNLQAAIVGLVRKADKTTLAAAMGTAGQLKKADYSADSWSKLETALKAANMVNGKENATKDEVDNAVKALNDAINGLVKVPGKPASVKVTWKGKKTVSITWKKAPNATKYVVYRSVKNKSTGFKKLGEGKKTSYTDKKAPVGKTAYYKVIAYNGSAKGAYSKAASTYIVKTPASVKAKAKVRDVTVSFKKSAKASGYEIWCRTGSKGSYKKAATLTSGKKVKKVFKDKKGGTYYYKVRAYKKSGKKKIYTDFGKAVKVKVDPGATIENTPAYLAIEGDVKLTGTGTGYHAKFVMATPTSAVSFGMQFDQHAVAPYTGKTMALIENVASNAAGQQVYTRPGDVSLELNKTHHLMMTVDRNGHGNVYVDYKYIGSFDQPNLVRETCYLRLEACARLNGDSVNATFSNIKCRWNGQQVITPKLEVGAIGEGKPWVYFKQNAGLTHRTNKNGSLQFFGTVQGINGDWDSDYNSVSYIAQLVV